MQKQRARRIGEEASDGFQPIWDSLFCQAAEVKFVIALQITLDKPEHEVPRPGRRRGIDSWRAGKGLHEGKRQGVHDL